MPARILARPRNHRMFLWPASVTAARRVWPTLGVDRGARGCGRLIYVPEPLYARPRDQPLPDDGNVSRRYRGDGVPRQHGPSQLLVPRSERLLDNYVDCRVERRVAGSGVNPEGL